MAVSPPPTTVIAPAAVAFANAAAMAFVPSNNTWHGFEPRPIPVVRKSLIVNYVTAEWRAREQLAYPDTPVVGRHDG